jgi:hypothetical protein
MVTERTPRVGCAFYCMSSDIYFLGAVGLVNSLRLLGHREPIFLLDCGLLPWQRELLARDVTIVTEAGEAVPPNLRKTIAPLRNPADVMVLIDADIVVTRSLSALVAAAGEDRVVVAENDRDRFFGEWQTLLGLETLRRRPYVSSGLILLGGSVGRHVLARMHELIQGVELDRTFERSDDPEYPLFYMEQDVLNGILAGEVDPDAVITLPHRLVPNPPFAGLRLLDERALRCAYDDGTEPYALHHFATKPWLEPARHGPYSRLLRRLLTGPDVAIPIDEAALPLRLRSGGRAWAARKRVDWSETLRWHVTEPLASKIRGGGRGLVDR